MKTRDLTGPALDWAVAKCEGFTPHQTHMYDTPTLWRNGARYNPSTDWSQGGPIIEREKLCLMIGHAGVWLAYSLQNYTDEPTLMVNGSTPLVAAMRCYVASKLGDEIEVPEELQ